MVRIATFALSLATAIAASLALTSTPALALSPAQEEFRVAVQRVPDLAKGEELFGTCAACHSHDGSGIADGSVPAIAGQHFPVIVKQLTDFRHDRRWDVRMEHFVDRHHLAGPSEVADVAGYLSRLAPQPSARVGDGSSLGAGTSVYFRLCSRCHGSSGIGDAARLVPRLAGQHYAYLVRQIHDTADGRRPGMAVDHVRLVRGLSVEQINGVADYLSRMRPAAAARK
ncbi:MAG: c-type cytochrome [Steroidobacteraceae bacterium]